MEEENSFTYNLSFITIKLNSDCSIEICPSEDFTYISREQTIFLFDLIQGKLKEAFFFLIHQITKRKFVFTSIIKKFEDDKSFVNEFLTFISMIKQSDESLNLVNNKFILAIEQEMKELENKINENKQSSQIQKIEELKLELTINEENYNNAIEKMQINHFEKIYQNLSCFSDPIIIKTVEALVCTLNNNLILIKKLLIKKYGYSITFITKSKILI